MVVYKLEAYVLRIRLVPPIISQNLAHNIHIAHYQEVVCSTANK
jgi:hypothetical protein